MNIPTKKLKNGFEMPVFGIGTYNMGSANDNNTPIVQDDRRDVAAIQAAVDLGVTLIDTAESYGQGRTETVVAQAIQNLDRQKLFLTSKVKLEHMDRPGIKSAIKGSLERLKTTYLDLYLLHRCPPLDKFQEVVDAMNELVDEGLVRFIGLSNTNAKHTKMLCDLTRHPFVVNQVHLNLQFREPEKDGLLEFCQKNDILLQAWRPVNKGALSKSGLDFTKSGIVILDELCQKYQKTPAQVAINWLIAQENVVTIAKSSNPLHLTDNLGAMGWQMDGADIEKLRKEFPDQKFISDTVPLS